MCLRNFLCTVDYNVCLSKCHFLSIRWKTKQILSLHKFGPCFRGLLCTVSCYPLSHTCQIDHSTGHIVLGHFNPPIWDEYTFWHCEREGPYHFQSSNHNCWCWSSERILPWRVSSLCGGSINNLEERGIVWHDSHFISYICFSFFILCNCFLILLFRIMIDNSNFQGPKMWYVAYVVGTWGEGLGTSNTSSPYIHGPWITTNRPNLLCQHSG